MPNGHGQIPPIDWHGTRFTGGLEADMGTPEVDGQIYRCTDSGKIFLFPTAGDPTGVQIYPTPLDFTLQEVGGGVSVHPVNTMTVPVGVLTDGGGGEGILTLPSPLTVEEVDGSPTITPVTKLKVPNGSLSSPGGGVATLAFNPVLQYARVQPTIYRTSSGSGFYALIWDQEDFDTITGFDLVSHPTRFTAPYTGMYQHNLVLVADEAATFAEIKVTLFARINGVTHTASHLYYADQTAHSLMVMLPLTAGDYVEWVQDTAGGGNHINVYDGGTTLQTYWEVLRLS